MRLDELGQSFVVRLVMRPQYKDGHKNALCVCMYVCMCVCMYVCVYVCMYVCMYVCKLLFKSKKEKKTTLASSATSWFP